MSNRNRIISLLITLVMLVCFAACGKNTSETNDAKQESSTTEAKEKTEGNSSPEKTSENKIEVVDIVGMTLPDAIDKLKNEGFSNINHNASSVDEAWIVTAQDPEEGKEILSSDKISLTCNKKCSLYLDLTSEDNLMFSQYDISVYLDDEEITVLKNGDSFTQLVEVLSGKHEIVFCKTGDKDFKCKDTISIEADTTYSCDLAHSSSSIDIKNKEVSDNIAGASLEMIDVTGMILSEARDALEKIGFSNITAKADAGIWDEDNWIVEKQSVDSGIKMDKNTEIVLSCIKLDIYFDTLFAGKNVNEILDISKELGFSIRFLDESSKNITEDILSLDESTRLNWIAINAKNYTFENKTAAVTIVNQVKEDTSSDNSSPDENQGKTSDEENPNTNNHVYYSTNDKQTVKEGKSGIYSYKSTGGTYDNYYIIDLDEGYVYFFSDGNGDTSCTKVKILSGTLNDVVVVKYDDHGSSWMEGLHFKWQNQPDTLIMQEEGGYEHTFNCTDIENALKLMEEKTITDLSPIS